MTKNVGDASTFKDKEICVGKYEMCIWLMVVYYSKMCIYLACGLILASPFALVRLRWYCW